VSVSTLFAGYLVKVGPVLALSGFRAGLVRFSCSAGMGLAEQGRLGATEGALLNDKAVVIRAVMGHFAAIRTGRPGQIAAACSSD
jgi:hypothetical protein